MSQTPISFSSSFVAASRSSEFTLSLYFSGVIVAVAVAPPMRIR